MAKNDIAIAEIKVRLDSMFGILTDMKTQLNSMYSRFASKEDLENKIEEVHSRIDNLDVNRSERIKRLEIIVYGMSGLILTGFVGALIALVYRK